MTSTSQVTSSRCGHNLLIDLGISQAWMSQAKSTKSHPVSSSSGCIPELWSTGYHVNLPFTAVTTMTWRYHLRFTLVSVTSAVLSTVELAVFAKLNIHPHDGCFTNHTHQ
uniref:Uncharacterized protein n=1 Tax=Mesocestoides corti TaxID=53468 RepID=A0A5K3F623_MESCO